MGYPQTHQELPHLSSPPKKNHTKRRKLEGTLNKKKHKIVSCGQSHARTSKCSYGDCITF
eukprot:UN12604